MTSPARLSRRGTCVNVLSLLPNPGNYLEMSRGEQEHLWGLVAETHTQIYTHTRTATNLHTHSSILTHVQLQTYTHTAPYSHTHSSILIHTHSSILTHLYSLKDKSHQPLQIQTHPQSYSLTETLWHLEKECPGCVCVCIRVCVCVLMCVCVFNANKSMVS